MNEKDSFSNLQAAREVFEFWKTVKDKLALPLLIDLCERASLAPPPCFMRLPTLLELKSLESLHGDDVAKVGSVCSELALICHLMMIYGGNQSLSLPGRIVTSSSSNSTFIEPIPESKLPDESPISLRKVVAW
ncbi:F-box protein SKIP22 [Camellia lanceoleosa]|uniref:F-box protein SKIP22 n=1 Tax=Camellia lanceoleosa TaxID=1840588 RepID=A0ACC0FSP5_9ERIC|nr:F-box protein SKIP22 [Camellia lanceoleosa]